MATIDVDLEQFIKQLPEQEQQEALAVMLTCDIEKLYEFIRSKSPLPQKMMLDMMWNKVTQEQKLTLNNLIRKTVASEFPEVAETPA